MKMSTKGRYAVMAMIDIGQHSAGSPVSLAEIAERQDISQEYLEQLFGKLRRAGLVESARGPGGGYRCRAMPPISPWPTLFWPSTRTCASPAADGDAVDGCVRGEHCCAHDLWSSLGRQMMYFLGSITLEDVVSKNATSRSPPSSSRPRTAM